MHNDDLHSRIAQLSNEVLQHLVSYLDASSALQLCQTCTRLRRLTKFCDQLWKRLIKEDFGVKLHTRRPFVSFYDIYRLLFMSRHILKVYLSERYTLICNHEITVLSRAYKRYTINQLLC